MSKKNKIIVITVTILVLIAAVIGIIFAIKKTTEKTVTVIPVAEINWGYWGSDVNISGMVTSNASQEIHLNDKQIVEEVFVQEGDVVQVGTPLLSFDMTMTSLNLESELLNKEGLEIQKRGLEGEINRLKKETPIPEPTEASVNGNIPAAYESGRDHYAGFITLSQNQGTTNPTQTPTTEGGVTPDPTPDGTATPTPTPDGTATPTPTPDGTVTPTPTPDGTATPTPTPNGTATPTPTPEGTVTPTPTPGATVTPTPTPEESITPTPPASVPAYECIDENSLYFGEGTKENPRSYLTVYNEDYTARVTGSFLNQSKTNGTCFYIGLRQENVNGGELLASIFINGSLLNEYEDDKIYLIKLYSADDIIEEPTETPEEEIPPIPEGYTQEELNTMIKEKQRELRSVNLDLKECELRIADIEKSLNDQQITSNVNGIVRSVGDPTKGEVNGEAFLVVESTEGLYVQGSISELMLGQIQEGHILTGTSWETGMVFDAEIREISPYPLDGNNYDGSGNSNASYYPFTAYIENGEGLRNNEYVGFTTTIGTDSTGESIYTEKMFVREENGISYVYIADENNRLKKQEVQVKNVDGYTIQILSGLSIEDRITFPYGKNIKEGAPVKDGTMNDLYSY